METMKVYRTGGLNPPKFHRDRLQTLIEFFDAHCPKGRQGRMGAIFANLSFEPVTRWMGFSGYAEYGVFPPVYELEVNPEGLYHYSINLWEQADDSFDERFYCSGSSSDESEEGINGEAFRCMKEYWLRGEELAGTDLPDSKSHWSPIWNRELLIAPRSIVSTRRLSNLELMELRDFDAEQIASAESLNTEEFSYGRELQKEVDGHFNGVLPPKLLGWNDNSIEPRESSGQLVAVGGFDG